MRLRRLLRTQAEYQQRLAGAGAGQAGALAPAASARLLQLLADVRGSWARESQGFDLAGLRGHVNRSLATMQAAAAAMARPGADLRALGGEFRDAGLPLVFFLRGLDDSPALAVAELTGEALPRSA